MLTFHEGLKPTMVMLTANKVISLVLSVVPLTDSKAGPDSGKADAWMTAGQSRDPHQVWAAGSMIPSMDGTYHQIAQSIIAAAMLFIALWPDFQGAMPRQWWHNACCWVDSSDYLQGWAAGAETSCHTSLPSLNYAGSSLQGLVFTLLYSTLLYSVGLR
jgi:hypothetical protein